VSPLSVTVVVCAYTLDRLALTERSLSAVLAQEPAPDQVVAVIDHNDELASGIAASFPAVEVVPNAGPPGLSSARNTGIAAARGEVVAFVDDDAEPVPGWLNGLLEGFRSERTMVVGGEAVPRWEAAPPGWFPEEYLWVVGCSFRGQRTIERVRNPLGCNMAFRRTVFETVGGFHAAIGRLGTIPLGAEETELCVRLRRADPGAEIRIVDGAVVHHFVPRGRSKRGYFIRRCYYEGQSKAAVRQRTNGGVLAPEAEYVVRALTSGTIHRLGRTLRLDRPRDQLGAIAMMWVGVAAAAVGYLAGGVRLRGSEAPQTVPMATRPMTDDRDASAR
jgi:GT2 family glycosyltransferase